MKVDPVSLVLAAGTVVASVLAACTHAVPPAAIVTSSAAAPAAPGRLHGAPTPPSGSDSLPRVREVALTVSSVEREAAFFQILDFSPGSTRDLAGAALDGITGTTGAHLRVARLHLGTEVVELRQFVGVSERAVPEDARSNDAAFQHVAIVVRDMDAAYARLREHGASTISPGPQTIPLTNPAAGGIRALYFRDPDRHALELIWFPPGRGKPRWQTGSGTFLGIDHTAIAVRDADAGERFYEALGFAVGGRSLNSGPEQEALSGVGGARVRITGLVPRGGAGVELLAYLAPGPGRGAAEDARVTDLLHWETTVEVRDLEAAIRDVERAGGRRVTPAPVDVRPLDLGYARAALVHDVDGHTIRLVAG